MRRFILGSIMIVIILMSLISCENKEDPNKVIAYIKGLKTYECTAKLEVINDVQRKEVDIYQVFKKDTGSYIKINEDRQIWFLPNKIIDNYIKQKKMLIQSRFYDNILEYTFLEKYIEKLYCDEKIKTKFAEEEGKRYLLVELILCSNNRNLDKAVIYINTEDGNPNRIEIYDGDKKVRMRITYGKFEGNAKIRDDFFDTKRLLNSD
ncbi:germination lipoprotein GerS-related protein [Oceanirhabdus sp. W0125-5]|uniref:germination lipoprotein GerS-related protein n=1 Tax=Oceanirhabdus sp. W0125-5 TaxID=2999116 RepID=UPI0022F33A94|nr:germination lipoprotein GerS-related protein [Oceanirhabdus sp. W0125-5]WBW99277.1 germination lipoprotein GerS-related protein [Oceanirhabdus sp. W0125-5]